MTAFIGGFPGGIELIVVLGLAVLLFGANKIPELARSVGQSMGEFRRGREEIEDELDGDTDGEGR
ncbi:twin arginine translocation system subunit TatAt protein [Halorhabdus tiamatea SARL4B]|uniref:Twin arginine translocation system subunit TatAt protein n=1 Tax=Halorhabdus tiamatea SARL4B TaxID=1033806 RepID=F7PI13_9EURY|nr:twin arginine translocation system subunit TatAt protein [Halorhabdus tiamatea SARL4B]CCQ32232.1 twin-arginine translocation protein TatA [Halorhabdus tiamatea SARL4B]